MKTPARYAQRIGRLPAVLELLAQHPDGLPLVELASRFDVKPEELREDLLAYYTADVADLLLGLSRPDVIEFLGVDGEDADPHLAEIVRVVDERPTDELGVEYVDLSELALVYAAARSLLDLEPDNEDLAAAVEVLTETTLGEAQQPTAPRSWNAPLPLLRRAIADQQRVEIVYSRAWQPGVTRRVIDPYRLVQTRRGWEVDAGPPDDQGRLRTFLVANLRTLTVLDDTFEPPADLDARLQQQRATETVRVQVPHAALWAADFFAEEVRWVADDADSATRDLDLLPPVDQRLGLLLLAAGNETRVLDPAAYVSAGPDLAQELLEHHCCFSREASSVARV